MIFNKIIRPLKMPNRTGFFNFSRNLHQDKHVFNGDTRPNKVFHYTFKPEKGDDQESVEKHIYRAVRGHKNSLVYLTQKSRLQVRTPEHEIMPLPSASLNNIAFLEEAIREQLLLPEAGHTSMVITNDAADIISGTSVSLRNSKKKGSLILSGRSMIHPHLYHGNQKLPVSLAEHSSFEEEVAELARRMVSVSPITGAISTIEAHITVLPIAHSKNEMSDIKENIQQVKKMIAYNLGTLVITKEDLNNVAPEHKHTRDYIRQLVIDPSHNLGRRLEKILSISGSEYVIAASACTNGIMLASTGKPMADMPEFYWDPATQDAVVYSVIKLTGIHQFIDFAREIDFLDKTGELTRKGPGV